MRRAVVAVAIFSVAVLLGIGWILGSGSAVEEVPVQARAAPLPIPPEHMPPPFEDRRVRLVEQGDPPASETAAFCDERNWAGLSESPLRPMPDGDGVFLVDAGAWESALTGSQAGLASWMSQCHQDGGPVLIVAHVTGERLAAYDPREGLQALR